MLLTFIFHESVYLICFTKNIDKCRPILVISILKDG